MSLKFHTAILLSIAFGTIGLPHIAMRYFTAPSVHNAKVSTLWGILFVGIVFFTTFAIGFAAKLYTVQELNPQGLAIQPKEADLLVVVMSQAFTPSWIAALPVAGALAAGMSTIGGLLMVIGTGLGNDIYSTVVPNASENKKVKAGFFFTALGGIVTIVLALNPPDFLLTSVIWAFVVASSTFTPVLILGIWWKGTNKAGAIAGMVIGGALSIALWWTKGTLFGFQFIKHCSDNEDGDLGVDYGAYDGIYDTLREAEAMADAEYSVAVKWSKIMAGNKRSYQRCYGPPFMIQLSGSGLVAPCGMLFNERYKKFHIGNICEQRFRDIWSSDRYWEVMNYLASPDFNAQKMCGSLCLQHKVNEVLDAYQKGQVELAAPQGPPPQHLSFI